MKKEKMRTYQQRQNRQGFLFMLPWLIGFAIFTAVPFVGTIFLSFNIVRQTVTGFRFDWVGLGNYFMAFFENTEFVPALLGYLAMIVPYTFVIVVLSFVLAYLLNSISFLRGFFRTIFFLPVIIMSGPVMYQLIDNSAKTDQMEGIRQFQDIFIVQMIQTYSSDLAGLLIGVLEQLSIIIWFTGIPIILYINGLQKINPIIYEAAQIESANAWQILWKITIPIIKPIVLIITIFTIVNIGTFSINPVYTLMEKTTENTSNGLGTAAAFASIYSFVVLFLIGIVFLLFWNRKAGKGE